MPEPINDELVEKTADALAKAVDEWPNDAALPYHPTGIAFTFDVLARAALEAVADDLRAEGWDRGKATVLELVGYPDVGWVNPYRKDADGGDD